MNNNSAVHIILLLCPSGSVTLQEGDGRERGTISGEDLNVQDQGGQALSHLHQGWCRKYSVGFTYMDSVRLFCY